MAAAWNIRYQMQIGRFVTMEVVFDHRNKAQNTASGTTAGGRYLDGELFSKFTRSTES